MRDNEVPTGFRDPSRMIKDAGDHGIYAYEGDYQLVKEPLLVSIDMGEIALA